MTRIGSNGAEEDEEEVEDTNIIINNNSDNTLSMLEKSDCFMIRVRENDQDDNNNDNDDDSSDHNSFVTAPASLSTRTTRTARRRTPQHNDNVDAEDLRSIVVRSSSNIPWYHRHWFCEDDSNDDDDDDTNGIGNVVQIKHIVLAEGPAFVRFAKFVLISFASIWIMYYLVRYLVRTYVRASAALLLPLLSTCQISTHSSYLTLPGTNMDY